VDRQEANAGLSVGGRRPTLKEFWGVGGPSRAALWGQEAQP